MRLIRHPHFIPWSLFVTFTTIYFASVVGLMNSLNASQFALTQALVEERNIKINHFTKWLYLDYAEHDGNIYSFKAPGESFLAIPFYLMAKLLLPFANLPYNGQYPGIDQDSKLESLTILGNATFGALVVILVYLISLKFTKSVIASLITACSVGLGTLLWRYSSGFQRFPITCFFLLVLILVLSINKKTIWHFLIFGLSVGILLLTDISLLIVILFLTLSLLFQSRTIERPKLTKNIVVLVLSIFSVLSLLLAYNYSAFGKFLTSPYLHTSSERVWNDPNNYFLVPIYPSIWVNLFNNGPIPQSTYPLQMWNNKVFQVQESLGWSTRNHYNGIFIQSPFLIFSLIGLFFLIKQKKIIGWILGFASILFIIQMSKFSGFYGPTAYDTHYFLPSIPLLSLGLAPFIALIIRKKRASARFLLLLVGISTAKSIYNGWYSTITNFAPHVTGEHKFSLEQLIKPLFAQEHIINNFSMLFTNTFPNIFNLHLLFIFYFPLLIVLFYGSYLLFVKKK